ncbi:hypothetical protein AB7W97_08800, partial [Providencia rettgeri]
DYHQTNQKTNTGKTLKPWPILVDHYRAPIKVLKRTLIKVLKRAPIKALKRTLIKVLKRTPIKVLKRTPIKVLKRTSIIMLLGSLNLLLQKMSHLHSQLPH